MTKQYYIGVSGLSPVSKYTQTHVTIPGRLRAIVGKIPTESQGYEDESIYNVAVIFDSLQTLVAYPWLDVSIS
jgi:hypothetical protein